MPSSTHLPTVFPELTRAAVLACQFSSWYPRFRRLTIKSTVIRPLPSDFRSYLEEDGVMLPEGAETVLPVSQLSDSEDSDSESDPPNDQKQYAFPELDARIRQAIEEYGAVFPKLNWTSPKDASWILSPSSPMKCATPADVYLLLKGSDFACHDIDPLQVFDGCVDGAEEHQLELVLRKWFAFDTSREMRCFVRRELLIGISQRDDNHYDHLNARETQDKILSTIKTFWENEIKGRWQGGGDYVFDILLTRDLSAAHIIDFNPYASRTDSLLFTYEELLSILTEAPTGPQLRVIDSPIHPRASRNAPANQHNMVPFEALQLSSGQHIDEFADMWRNEIQHSSMD